VAARPDRRHERRGGRPTPGQEDDIRDWHPRRWATAALATLVVAALIGLPTEMIPNPIFGRMMPVEWWNYPAWIVSSILAGLLVASYVRQPAGTSTGGTEGTPSAPSAGAAAGTRGDVASRHGGVGGLLAFFAVGCPVCNKLVVLALGTSGAMAWFAPFQPVLALGAVALLAVALRSRLRNERACAVPTSDVTA
jgi:hypothetical protein